MTQRNSIPIGSSARAAFALLTVALMAACGGGANPLAANDVPELKACAPGQPPLQFNGSAESVDARSYTMLPFEVGEETSRIEFSYGWVDRQQAAPTFGTVIDLGMWDEAGYRSAEGFRGWSGSRLAKSHSGQDPAFIEPGAASRGYYPGVIRPGVWTLELGFGWVADGGTNWTASVTCLSGAASSESAGDPVNPAHVANPVAGWYHADFHMHGFHSAGDGPNWSDMVAQARAANLDALMITEYVTGQHWQELGAIQDLNPDLLIWPGREIITYFGHANTHGETPGVLEYRHGFEDVTLKMLQSQAVAAGALFQINHPTTFPPPSDNLCRGCALTLADDELDWSNVHLLEVVTSPVRATSSDLPTGGGPPGEVENPFLQNALDLWDGQLMNGNFPTAVSGSDSKGNGAAGTIGDPEFERRGYGSSATAILADSLSRADLTEALLAGRAYIRTLGVTRSPTLSLEIAGPMGQTGTFGATIALDNTQQATLTVTVNGAAGQQLMIIQNGEVISTVPIPTDVFVHQQAVVRSVSEGPLGTFIRVETRDEISRTTIGNPVFLQSPN